MPVANRRGHRRFSGASIGTKPVKTVRVCSGSLIHRDGGISVAGKERGGDEVGIIDDESRSLRPKSRRPFGFGRAGPMAALDLLDDWAIAASVRLALEPARSNAVNQTAGTDSYIPSSSPEGP